MPSAVRRAIGQLLIGSFPSTTIPAELRSLAREFSLGGVILFARNIEEPGQVAELARDLQSLGGELPLWVSVDQEGGRVARLRAPFTEWPPMATLGRSGDEGLASRFAAALAAELSAVGITLDYAPVLDIHTNAEESRHRRPSAGRGCAIPLESSGQPSSVVCRTTASRRAASTSRDMATRRSIHTSSCRVVEHPPDRIRRVECVPFREAIKADVAFMMTAHVLVPSLDEEKPATLSRTHRARPAREELGYEGVILSDDLEMKAIAAVYTVPDAAVQAIAAGCDGVLICSGRHRNPGDRLSKHSFMRSKTSAFRMAVSRMRWRGSVARKSAFSPLRHLPRTARRARRAVKARPTERSWGARPIAGSLRRWRDSSKTMSFTLLGSPFSVRVQVRCSVRGSMFNVRI